MAPFHRAHMTCYWRFAVTMAVSRIVSDVFDVDKCLHLELTVTSKSRSPNTLPLHILYTGTVFKRLCVHDISLPRMSCPDIAGQRWLIDSGTIRQFQYDFSTIFLASGDRKGIRPVKNGVLVCWWWQFYWRFARLTSPVVAITSIILNSRHYPVLKYTLRQTYGTSSGI